jgi:hypothetical protein
LSPLSHHGNTQNYESTISRLNEQISVQSEQISNLRSELASRISSVELLAIKKQLHLLQQLAFGVTAESVDDIEERDPKHEKPATEVSETPEDTTTETSMSVEQVCKIVWSMRLWRLTRNHVPRVADYAQSHPKIGIRVDFTTPSGSGKRSDSRKVWDIC